MGGMVPASRQDKAALPLRLTLGIMFAAHGAQKLFGWFGGPGFSQTAETFAQMGLKPGLLMAGLAGGAEFFGGLCLIAGFLTRLASIPLIVTMLVAIATVHGKNGFFLQNGGFEYNFVILGGLLSLLLLGSGVCSVDSRCCSSKGACCPTKG